jgi:hypothetical protein
MNKNIKHLILFAFALLGSATLAMADKVNVDKSGLALQGHDPVAFFTDSKPVKGLPSIQGTHAGATYRFATEENLKTFTANPEKYVPAFGGYCAWAVSKGYTAKVEIDTWQIHEGRLVLNYDQGIKKKFNKDLTGNYNNAVANWPKVSSK